MNCCSIAFSNEEVASIIISSIIGLFFSILVPLIYDFVREKRIAKSLKKELQHFESQNDNYDWERWGITDKKINSVPSGEVKKINYLSERKFEFVWKQDKTNTNDSGKGTLYCIDASHGYLTFITTNNSGLAFNKRLFFYMKIEHLGVQYHALFICAADNESKELNNGKAKEEDYVLLKKCG